MSLLIRLAQKKSRRKHDNFLDKYRHTVVLDGEVTDVVYNKEVQKLLDLEKGLPEVDNQVG